MRAFGKWLWAVVFLALVGLAGGEPGGRVTSWDFGENGGIPARFTCEGEDVSPGLKIAGVPAGTKSLALVVEDPNAPGGVFTHWLVWNIPAGVTKIADGRVPAGAVLGRADLVGKYGKSEGR